MKYPSYIPAVVMAFISERIDGGPVPSDGPSSPYLRSLLIRSCRGLTSAQENTKKKLKEFEERIDKARGEQADSEIAALEEHRAMLCMHLTHIKEQIDLHRRLAGDERMREAYMYLTREFNCEQQWRGFLSAAIQAEADYDADRISVKRAGVLAKKIAATCAQLMEQLSEFDDLAMDNAPAGLNRIPDLVREESYPIIKWLQAESEKVLAKHGLAIHLIDAPLQSGPFTGHPSSGSESENEKPPYDVGSDCLPDAAPPEIGWSAGDPEEAPGNFLDALRASGEYAQLAEFQRPQTIELIEEIAVAAKTYTPKLYGAAGAATKSRKNNRKIQYIRAMWYIIQHRQFVDIQKTSNVMHALAITASVVLNGLDDDVSYDDVRKALEDSKSRGR